MSIRRTSIELVPASDPAPAVGAVLTGQLVHILPDLFDAAATGLGGVAHHVGLSWTPPVAVSTR